MKIGCLLDCASRNAGGLFESVRRIAQSFPQKHGKTLVFSLEDEYTSKDVAQWQPLDVQLHRTKWLHAWGYAPGLVESLLDAELEMLMTHGIWKYSSLACHRWHQRTSRPYIIHPHGMLDPWAVRNSKWKKRAVGLLYENAHLRNAACLRALCESEAQSMRAYGLRNPICIIPNGIDLPDVSVTRKLDSWDKHINGRKVLLYLGRLHPKKNLGPLMEAWAALQRDGGQGKNWVLAVAGWDQGGYEAELMRQAHGLGLPITHFASTSSSSSSDPAVMFAGPLFGEAKAAAYQNASAFVLPSLSEGLPMVVLEAWAFGKPVLMTPECNLPEGFQAQAALRVATDAASVTTGLRQLTDMSDAELTEMGDRGRQLVAEKFLWSQIGEEMRRVCNWAMNGGTPPASMYSE